MAMRSPTCSSVAGTPTSAISKIAEDSFAANWRVTSDAAEIVSKWIGHVSQTNEIKPLAIYDRSKIFLFQIFPVLVKL